MPERSVFGWDIGGAHLKACRFEAGRLADVALWACPLWQGLDRLEQAFAAAQARWPELPGARHAVTMTGEMADLFADREDGVRRIAAHAASAVGEATRFFAGDAGWCTLDAVPRHWAQVASANWLASAKFAARRVGAGLLLDIGSTTTDIVALHGGAVASASRSDAERLASGELVYHGVVRTPLCAVAPRIALRGTRHRVMNEFFASSADVYRLTGELDAAHDLHPSADGAPKDLAATRQRLARMIGLDARDASPEDWRACALAWREAQLAHIAEALHEVAAAHGMPADAPIVAAGCGSFLAEPLAAASGRPLLAYAQLVGLPPDDALARAAQVCAPCVAVAALFEEEQRAWG